MAMSSSAPNCERLSYKRTEEEKEESIVRTQNLGYFVPGDPTPLPLAEWSRPALAAATNLDTLTAVGKPQARSLWKSALTSNQARKHRSCSTDTTEE
jgi:hypothetical protein